MSAGENLAISFPDYAANQRLVKASSANIRIEYQQTEDMNPNKPLIVRFRIMHNVPYTFSLHFSFRRRGSLTQLITFTKCVSIIPQRDISVFVSSAFSSLSQKFLEHLNDCTRVCYNTAAVKASRLGRTVAMYAKKRRKVLETRPLLHWNNSRFPPRETSVTGTCAMKLYSSILL